MTLREKIKYKLSALIEQFIYLRLYDKNKILYPRVIDEDRTVNFIVSHRASVSRFGDGEMSWILGEKKKSFEVSSELLSCRLLEVLQSNLEGHIRCIPNVIETINRREKKSKIFWMANIGKYAKYWDKYANSYPYFDTNFTRFYIGYKDKHNSKINQRVNNIKRIWDHRDVLFIEGAQSRLGVGNDLFSNTKSIKRIICPTKNAFEKYDNILKVVKVNQYKLSKDTLILCALGPTATILAFDLHKLGYQSVDIGHLDIEYMWFQMQVEKKTAIPGKFVNEVGGLSGEVYLPQEYYNSIIGKVE